MAAPKGHAKWGNPIKPKSYLPEELWIGAMAYFDWCDSHPWKRKEPIKSGEKVGKIINIPTQRPYSIEGLCNHLDISVETFNNYSKASGYETYFGVCSRIRQTIDNQHFEGGMVGSFNANIVTRKLGLADKRELTGKDGNPIEIVSDPLQKLREYVALNREARECDKLPG